MNETNGKLQLFLDAIREAAEESCREKEQEAAAYARAQLEQAEKEVQEQHAAEYQQAIRQVEQETDAKLSDYRGAVRQRLCQLRDAYEQTIFRDVREALTAFTATPAYGELLERSAARMAAALTRYGDAEAVLYLRPADLSYASRVQAAFGRSCRVETDDTIALGGLRLRSDAARLLIDDTLETRLQQQKPSFRQSADLKVL